MTEISFSGLNCAWEKSFVFDSVCELNIGNLKELIISANNDFRKSQQMLVYEGSVMSSDSLLVGDLIGSGNRNRIVFQVFSVKSDQKITNLDLDPLSIAAAKEYLACTQPNACSCFDGACLSNNFCSAVAKVDPALAAWKSLLDNIADRAPTAFAFSTNPTDTTTAEAAVPVTEVAVAEAQAAVPAAVPAVVPAVVPVVPVVPAAGPVLPMVDWLQWGVMAKLIVVAFLFTYNRNLSTERLVHMAAMTVFSYFFQIGALSYWATWVCFKLGFDVNPPPRPLPNNNNNNNNNDADNANNDANNENNNENNAENEGNNVNDALNAADGAVAAAAPNNVLPNNAPNGAPNNARNNVRNNVRGNAQAVAPPAPAAPFNLVQWLNAVYHSGFTIPTAPGILFDLLALFMGLFFSIVPTWAPYRL